MSEIPPYITVAQVGKACGMKTRKARFMLQRAGILERLGAEYAVGDSRLRERLPEAYDRVYAYFVLQEKDRAQEDTREHHRALEGPSLSTTRE